jgi:hypothetical protein
MSMNLNTIAAATAREDAARICELCCKAGRPDLMARFVAKGTPPHAVATQLQRLRGSVSTTVRTDAGSGAFDPAKIETRWDRPEPAQSVMSTSHTRAMFEIPSRIDGAPVIH